MRRGRVFQNTDPNEWGSYPESSAPVSPVLALVGFVGLCLLVAAADGSIVAGAARGWYLSLNRPPGHAAELGVRGRSGPRSTP